MKQWSSFRVSCFRFPLSKELHLPEAFRSQQQFGYHDRYSHLEVLVDQEDPVGLVDRLFHRFLFRQSFLSVHADRMVLGDPLPEDLEDLGDLAYQHQGILLFLGVLVLRGSRQLLAVLVGPADLVDLAAFC